MCANPVGPPPVPFQFDRPLDPEKDQAVWVDRPLELDRVQRHLSLGRWVVLFGRKGLGRTSLLHWVKGRCVIGTRRPVAVMLNLRTLKRGADEPPAKSFAAALCRALEAQLGAGEPIDPGLVRLAEQRAPAVASCSDLQEFLTDIPPQCSEKAFHLILDDADLANAALRDEVFRAVRALQADFLSQPDLAFGLTVCGDEERKGNEWLGAPIMPDSDLRGLLGCAWMEPFEYTQVRDLVERGKKILGIELEGPATAEVLILTGGVPASVQRLLYHLYDYAQGRRMGTVTDDLVREMAQRLCLGPTGPSLRAGPTIPPDRGVDGVVDRFAATVERLNQAIEQVSEGDSLRRILGKIREGEAAPEGVREPGSAGARFYDEHAREILTTYPGEWIAVTSAGIVAHHPDGAALKDQLQEMDFRLEAPYIVRVGPDEIRGEVR